jgi:hypothetical protein
MVGRLVPKQSFFPAISDNPTDLPPARQQKAVAADGSSASALGNVGLSV